MGLATEEQVSILIELMRKNDAERQAEMPDTEAALSRIFSATERLRKLGWRDGIYCPKNGANFAVVEFGLTGIFTGNYSGKWPNGYLCLADSTSSVHGIMWKEISDLSEEENTQRLKCAASDEAYMKQLARLERGSQ